jgi:hypothetical protein
MTKGKFGFHRSGGEHETGTAAYVQIYVKLSAPSRAPDLAISVHLRTEAEIDEFMDDALAELEEIRIDAKKALAAAAWHFVEPDPSAPVSTNDDVMPLAMPEARPA